MKIYEKKVSFVNPKGLGNDQTVIIKDLSVEVRDNIHTFGALFQYYNSEFRSYCMSSDKWYADTPISKTRFFPSSTSEKSVCSTALKKIDPVEVMNLVWFMIENGYDAVEFTKDTHISARHSPVSKWLKNIILESEKKICIQGDDLEYFKYCVNKHNALSMPYKLNPYLLPTEFTREVTSSNMDLEKEKHIQHLASSLETFDDLVKASNTSTILSQGLMTRMSILSGFASYVGGCSPIKFKTIATTDFKRAINCVANPYSGLFVELGKLYKHLSDNV
jgi:hypothetical protein